MNQNNGCPVSVKIPNHFKRNGEKFSIVSISGSKISSRSRRKNGYRMTIARSKDLFNLGSFIGS